MIFFIKPEEFVRISPFCLVVIFNCVRIRLHCPFLSFKVTAQHDLKVPSFPNVLIGLPAAGRESRNGLQHSPGFPLKIRGNDNLFSISEIR
jgi:hypothetical protein